ncbi:zeta toxin family protein [Neobacillus sp. GCM10023253]|uniref:zeta toxin family protein n=1 Tax=Neobacillus sp. GCM10023253 TaxID=3252644 RepID=UPI0036203824
MRLSTQKLEVREDLITAKKYRINGDYVESRAEKHRVIIFNKLKDREPNEDRQSILLAGGAGAGKSTIVEQYFLPETMEDSVSDFILIDSDKIKEELDEYKEYKESEDTVYFAAFYVHEESGHIVKLLLQECINRGLSFIYDGTMSWKPLYDDLITKLNQNAYSITGVYVDVELEVAQARAIKRGEEEKRYVDPAFVELANRNSAITFRKLKQHFDEVLMFNNTEDRIDKNQIVEPFYIRGTPFTQEFEDGEIKNPFQLSLFKNKSELPYIGE